MNFKEEQERKIQEIEAILQKYLPCEEGFQKVVMEAMNYSVKAGGKRLRPMLMFETFQLFGGTGKEIEPFLAAIEWIHTYSLVHDDLPAMDNDEYRRGQKTTHIVYGHSMGILAGDALLNYAFETAGKSYEQIKEKKSEFELEEYTEKLERILRSQKLLADKAGIYGMVGGQVVDVRATEEKEVLSEEKLDFIYRLKTSALIEAAMEIGAILGRASEEELAIVEQIAEKIGLAFQIQDDILDVTSTKEVLGKPIFSDEKNQKVTYVSLKGLAYSAKRVEQLSKEAIELLEALEKRQGRRNVFLTELLLWLIHREK